MTVVVLGGGPAGAVAALTLARGGVDTLVLEASEGPFAKIGENLPPTVRPLVERLGLAAVLGGAEHRHCFGHRSVWGSDETVEEDFLFGTFGAGWHLDRARFEAGRSDAATEAGARWRWDHHAVDARWVDGRWILEVEAPEALVEIEARFVIDATGRQARFARGAGAQQQQLDKLVGVAVILGPGQAKGTPLDGFTLVEARPRGWWYSAPLSGDRVVVVYMTDGDQLRASEARTPGGWSALMDATVHTRRRIAAHLEAGARPDPRVMPAGSTYLQRPWGEGWIAIGDAAVAFDPLSSHGMGSAMTTGYYGACAVADHVRGRHDALTTYEGLVARMYEDYLGLLHEHYRREQRWAQEPFWSRRHRRWTTEADAR